MGWLDPVSRVCKYCAISYRRSSSPSLCRNPYISLNLGGGGRSIPVLPRGSYGFTPLPSPVQVGGGSRDGWTPARSMYRGGTFIAPHGHRLQRKPLSSAPPQRFRHVRCSPCSWPCRCRVGPRLPPRWASRPPWPPWPPPPAHSGRRPRGVARRYAPRYAPRSQAPVAVRRRHRELRPAPCRTSPTAAPAGRELQHATRRDATPAGLLAHCLLDGPGRPWPCHSSAAAQALALPVLLANLHESLQEILSEV